ncbi:MAG: hypothetical protein AB1758_38360, partial [Candidatus Eremiobacterota bacterium]
MTEVLPDGTSTTTLPDGTVTTTSLSPDPRFDMQAPFLSLFTTSTGGLTAVGSGTRSVVLADPVNPLSLQSMTETSVF